MPSILPTIRTQRLVLRAFHPNDAAEVQLLAGDFKIANTTLNIPHPYENGMAEKWIDAQAEQFAEGRLANFAITIANDETLCGSIGLVISQRHNHAELGYWLGVPFWGEGYCTEAARAVIDFGFGTLSLHRIYSNHMTRNPASGRVMQKLGMTYEGRQRGHLRKWQRYEDIEMYGLLASEWDKTQTLKNK